MDIKKKPILKSGHVLIVDDEPDVVQKGLAKVLQPYNITSATSGPEAIKLLEDKIPDVVVLDMRMPGMHGIEVLQKIQNMHRYLPVIIYTAWPGDVSEEAIKGYEPFANIEKPNVDQLVPEIRRAVEYFRTYTFKVQMDIQRAQSTGSTCPHTIFANPRAPAIEPIIAKELPKARFEAQQKMRYGDRAYCRISTFLEGMLAYHNLCLCGRWNNRTPLLDRPDIGLKSRDCEYYMNPIKEVKE